MFRTLCCLLALVAAPVMAKSAVDPSLLKSLPHVSFHGPNQLASGYLKSADIDLLKRAGIRHVIDLSDDAETPDFDEASALRAIDIGYANLPIDDVDGLSAANVHAFDALIAATNGEPTLIHCASSNRVGALIALRAGILQGATTDEAMEIGKAWGLKRLEPAVRERLVLATASTPQAAPKPAADLEFPRIASAGGVYALPDGVQFPDKRKTHRLVIDATADATTASGINRHLEVAARAVNLYALAGVDAKRVKIAVVIHGKATPIVLSDASYRAHFGKANPDAGILAELKAAGVEFFVCGQATMHRGYTVSDVRDEVHVALSAMTMLAELQAAGYALIP